MNPLTLHVSDAHAAEVAKRPLKVILSCAKCAWHAVVYGEDYAEKVLRVHMETHHPEKA